MLLPQNDHINYAQNGTTGYPIEKYVGWTNMSSYYTFDISGVIPHFGKYNNFLGASNAVFF